MMYRVSCTSHIEPSERVPRVLRDDDVVEEDPALHRPELEADAVEARHVRRGAVLEEVRVRDGPCRPPWRRGG